jgi:hypothetical protein
MTVLQIPISCFKGITVLSLLNFGRTALHSRVSMQGCGQTPISGCGSASPHDSDGVPVRYQEVAAVLIRAFPRPAICAWEL